MKNAQSTTATSQASQNPWALINGPVEALNEVESIVRTAKLALDGADNDDDDSRCIAVMLNMANEKMTKALDDLQLLLDVDIQPANPA